MKKKQINTLFYEHQHTNNKKIIKKKTRKKSCLKKEYIRYKQVRSIKYTFVTIKHLIVKIWERERRQNTKKKCTERSQPKKKRRSELKKNGGGTPA